MSAIVSWHDVEVGTELPPRTFTIDRATLVRYAGASGDFNVIHWNERVATALGGRVVTDWVGDPGAVVEYGVRFTRLVVVPDDDAGATIEVTGKVSRKDEDGIAQVTLTVRYEGATVLGKAQALVRLG
jgi:acyl dehydratase